MWTTSWNAAANADNLSTLSVSSNDSKCYERCRMWVEIRKYIIRWWEAHHRTFNWLAADLHFLEVSFSLCITWIYLLISAVSRFVPRHSNNIHICCVNFWQSKLSTVMPVKMDSARKLVTVPEKCFLNPFVQTRIETPTQCQARPFFLWPHSTQCTRGPYFD